MDSVFAQLSETVSASASLEDLTRPMLEMLEAVTGLESTYLTTVDQERNVQQILFSRNTGSMLIPEGLEVAWPETLCKRAIEEGRAYTPDVMARWGDLKAAQELGIETYISMPVLTGSGGLYGTLCGVSATPGQAGVESEGVLGLFANLIGQYLEREQLFRRLQEVSAELASRATTDALTGLPNRSALLDSLQQMLSFGAREGRSVLVAFIDLDGFKAINDEHGHDAGDEYLAAIALRLRSTLRDSDVLGRIGGDEFVAIAPGPSAGSDAENAAAAAALAERLGCGTVGQVALQNLTLDFAGASVGVAVVDPNSTTADEAVRLADAEMYRVKRARKGAAANPTL